MSEPLPPVVQPPLKPTTTGEQDLRTASQRKINLIWEFTQAAIAIFTVVSNIIYIFLLLFVRDITSTATNAAVLLSNGFFLIIGFYFGRTNHARIGDDPIGHSRTNALDDR